MSSETKIAKNENEKKKTIKITHPLINLIVLVFRIGGNDILGVVLETAVQALSSS